MCVNEEKTKIRFVFFFLDFFVFRVLAKNSKIKKKSSKRTRGWGKKHAEEKRKRLALAHAHILRTESDARER